MAPRLPFPEIQQHVAKLPDTIERLEQRLGELQDVLVRLQESLDPISRVAGRLPGRRRGGADAA